MTPTFLTQNLEWKKGPALGGPGTAGVNASGISQWWDGDMLLIAVETNSGVEIYLVVIYADDECFDVRTPGGDSFSEWDPESWSYYAVLKTPDFAKQEGPQS